ncbi:MAG TPA: M48 family metallopeptidase [Pseudonocardiaceae bacterium]|jgi:Zn-dependent protease with chaperone function|nr:M48 family metallopeptidase [Pseudonocardiaceae bacterium]
MESSGRGDAQIVRSRVRFPGISPRAYEHPADRGALTTLRSVPGFPVVLKAVSGAFSERGERLLTLGSAVRVGPKQYPVLHQLRADCCDVLDIDPVPELFVIRDPNANGMAIGLDQPFVVLTTGMVAMMDTEALRVVIGHELGHVLSGHALYRTLLFRLIRMMQGLSWLPLGYWGLRAIVAALREWYRKAELSADRAGLLCSQDPAAALRGHVLLAGAIEPADVDTAEFLRQAADYESGGDVRDSVLKLLNTMDDTHPLAVVRAAELQRWAASSEYRAILGGEYQRRDDGDQPASTWTQDVKDAARSYRDTFVESTDPLAKVLTEVGGVISGTANKVWQRFGGKPDEEQPPEE